MRSDELDQLEEFDSRQFDRLVHGENYDDELDDDDGQIEVISEKGLQTPRRPQVPQTPKPTPARTPNKFAQFVKDHYNTIKKEKNLASHKDVMQELSKNFKALSTK